MAIQDYLSDLFFLGRPYLSLSKSNTLLSSGRGSLRFSSPGRGGLSFFKGPISFPQTKNRIVHRRCFGPGQSSLFRLTEPPRLPSLTLG